MLIGRKPDGVRKRIREMITVVKKLRIRLTFILPLIFIPLYLVAIRMIELEALKAIDENDRMGLTLSVSVLGISAFLGWLIVWITPLSNIAETFSLYWLFTFTCLIHYSILGLCIDGFIFWRTKRENKKEELEKEWYSNIQNEHMPEK